MSELQDRFNNDLSTLYIKKLLFKIAITLLIIGGINWLLIGLFDLNLVTSLVGKGVLCNLIYI